MGVFKRALTSVIQRRVNSIILLVIVFILSNVLLTTLSVNTSIKSTKDSVLSQLSPLVSIDVNPKIWEKEELVIPPLTAKMATDLYQKTKDIVKVFDYTQTSGLVAPTNFKESEILTPEQKSKFDGGGDINIGGSALSMSAIGTQLPIKVEGTAEGKLISGKGFSQKELDEGAYKIQISKQFAETNGLEIGSRITLSSEIYKSSANGEVVMSTDVVKPDKVISYEFEVSGIVQINKLEEFIKKAKDGDINKLVTEYYQTKFLGDQVYMPNNTLNKISNEVDEANKEINPELAAEQAKMGFSNNVLVQPQFVLKDMKNLNAFKKEAVKLYDEEKYSINSASDSYDIAAKPLQTMGSLLDTIFLITVIASIVILGLVLCIFMYLRQKEMGIFLALGERKLKIIGQLLLETLIIAIVGASLAIFTSILFSNILADNAMQSLLAPSEEIMNGMNLSLSANASEITPEMISQQYSGGFAFSTILIFYGTMLVTIIVAQLATVLYLLRLSPKKILM